jgi:hypothetical protein
MQVGNTKLLGTNNIAIPFSCIDDGGNTGQVSFNAGVDTCP